MRQYLELLQEIMDHGVDKPNRTGVDTRSLFARSLRFNLQEGFPAVTTKKLAFRPVVAELIGFIHGYDNASDFRSLGCNIWNANANENEQWLNNPNRRGEDDLGRIYGVQWRDWKASDGTAVDQLRGVVERIKKNPNDRRLVVTAWNPGELDKMALPPCHMFFQFYVANDKLSLQMYQRSCDMFLGVPFNIASYALLLEMVARETDLLAHELTINLGDVHIYHNHFEQVATQLARNPLPLPMLWLDYSIKNIEDFAPGHIELIGYNSHPAIKAPMAV